MHFKYCLLAAVFYTSFAAHTKYKTNETCEEAVRNLDNYGQQLYLFEDCIILDHNHSDEYCRSVQSAETAINNYAINCLNPFPSQLVRILIDDFAKSKLDVCDNETTAEKATSTLQQPRKLDLEPLNQCMNGFIHHIQYIRDNVTDVRLKLPFLCCGFYGYKNCVINQTADDKEDLEFMKKNTEIAAVGTINFLCRFTGEDAQICKDSPNIELKTNAAYKSFLPPLIDIYNFLNDYSN